MASEIKLRVSGASELTRRLKAQEAAAVDLRPVWLELRERFVRYETRTFSSQGGVSGRWAPLSPEYGAWKAQHYGGKRILQRSGDLMRSLSSDLAIEVITPHSMLLGSDSRYGHFHQTGTKNMPRRKVIDLSEGERRLWIRAIRDHLMLRNVGSTTAAAA